MLDVALDGAGVFDLESLPLLEPDEAWAASEIWDVMVESDGMMIVQCTDAMIWFGVSGL